jgi:hypothetical protein
MSSFSMFVLGPISDLDGGEEEGKGGGPLRREGNERCPDRNTEVSHFLSGDRSEDTGGYSRAQGGGGQTTEKGISKRP